MAFNIYYKKDFITKIYPKNTKGFSCLEVRKQIPGLNKFFFHILKFGMGKSEIFTFY